MNTAVSIDDIITATELPKNHPPEVDHGSMGWIQRRSDRQFTNPDNLTEYLKDRSAKSATVLKRNSDIQILADDQPKTVDDLNRLSLLVDGQELDFSHWSFGQIASLAKAPASYLRTLPGQLVRDNLLYVLQFNRKIEEVKLYHDHDHLRAITGPKYGRVDDYAVVEAVQTILDSGRWTPAEDHMGLRVSDRSVNMFMIDRENPVVVGRAPDGADDVMFRGLRISNSEVGFSSLKVEGFTFRSYCLNGCIFGMRDSETINIRHSANAPHRWAREVQPAIERYANEDGSTLVKAVEAAKETKVAEDNDKAIAWLTNRGLTRKQAGNAIERVQLEEGRDPRTAWDMMQGITAIARKVSHVEDRAELERIGGRIFEKVAA